MPFWVKYLINTYKILNESEVANNTDFRNERFRKEIEQEGGEK